MIRKTILTAALLAGAMMSQSALAQTTPPPATAGSTCGVQQAAQQALTNKLALINASRVNPNDFFAGVSSCISPQLSQLFDLSKIIPDPAGFATSALQNVANAAIQAAKQQVCSAINEQLTKTLGKINEVLGVTSNPSTAISNILNGSDSSLFPNMNLTSTLPSGASDNGLPGSSTPGTGINDTTIRPGKELPSGATIYGSSLIGGNGQTITNPQTGQPYSISRGNGNEASGYINAAGATIDPQTGQLYGASGDPLRDSEGHKLFATWKKG